MATTDELRTSIDEKRQALRDAITSAGDRWEVAPGADEWTPRATAEHAIGMEYMYAAMLADALMGRVPERPDLALSSAPEALKAFEQAVQDCTPGLQRVVDQDLARAAELRGDVPSPDIPKTVEGVLWLTAFHLDDHGKQIAAA